MGDCLETYLLCHDDGLRKKTFVEVKKKGSDVMLWVEDVDASDEFEGGEARVKKGKGKA